MKKWAKVLLIISGCLVGIAALVVPISLVVFNNFKNDIFDNTILPNPSPNPWPNPSIPEWPQKNIATPTNESVKKNYDVKSLGVDVNKSTNFPYQQPTKNNSNIYNVSLSADNLNKIFDKTNNTLYFNFDPILSESDSDINVFFNLPNEENTFNFSQVETIIFYIKKIPEDKLKDNFMKKMIFKTMPSSSIFLNFDKLKNFIVYEEEQSCFKAPSNYFQLKTNSLPLSVTNIYSDASFWRIDWYGTNKWMIPDFSSYINLEKLIFDVNDSSIFNSFMDYFNFSIFCNIAPGAFINSPQVKIYSTISLGFNNFAEIESFKQSEFIKDNPNYDGFKIPYYLKYNNPLIVSEQIPTTPSFMIPENQDSDIYSVFLWDKYFNKIFNNPDTGLTFINYVFPNFALKLLINKELADIAMIKLPLWL